MQLIVYDKACRAIAECRTVDEVREITNRAEAARAYARQAQNRSLEIDAVEIRVRAERRLGEMLIELRGVRTHEGRGAPIGPQPRLKLADLGITSKGVAGSSQRLALLLPEKFERELREWRLRAPRMRRLETPLQRYRVPHIIEDRQKAAHRAGRHLIEAKDPLDAFRCIDGMRVADWRIDRLDRLEASARKMLRVIETLRGRMPNGVYVETGGAADPSWTVEMVFPANELLSMLRSLWDDAPLPRTKGGLAAMKLNRSVDSRTRVCANDSGSCPRKGKPFLMKRKPHRDRPSEGQFCSRSCAVRVRKRAGGRLA